MPLFDTQDPNTDDRTRIDPGDPVIAAFTNNMQEMADQNAIVMREMQQTFGRAAEFESFQLSLPNGQTEPALLAGFDLSRLRMMVVSTEGGVVIGHRGSVAVNQGFALPQNAAFEVKTIQDVYIKNAYSPNVAFVSVWIEKSAQ